MSKPTESDPHDMTREELIAEVRHWRRTSTAAEFLVNMNKGVRKNSEATLFGLPLVSIAYGPDPENGELRGHARGIIAMGDVATGVLAIGGFARGGIAIGGLAIGVIALGGAALSILLAIGGLAIGGIAIGGGAIGGLALGGGAIGIVALGGGAVGYYAFGGDAFGVHVINATFQSPEAVEFFGRFVPPDLIPDLKK